MQNRVFECKKMPHLEIPVNSTSDISYRYINYYIVFNYMKLFIFLASFSALSESTSQCN